MKKIKNKSNLIIFILFVTALFFMSVGFAAYNQTINLNGTVVVKPDGDIYLKSVRTVSTSKATASPEIKSKTGYVDLNLSLKKQKNQEDGYTAVFEIVIANESSYSYVYTVPDYRPTASKNGTDYSGYVDYVISGITTGDAIQSKTEKIITVTFTFRNPENSAGTYIIDGDFIPDFNEDESATLRAVVDETQTGDLTGTNELALYEISVMNTYNVAKTITIISENDKFETRNLNNTDTPQYTIPANTTEQILQFYLKIIPGSDFTSTSERVRISIMPTGESGISAGRVIALVDRTIDNYTDTTPPTISNVTATIQNTNGTALITWEGEDDSGEDPQSYTIICFNSSGEEVSRQTVAGTAQSYTYTGLSAGTYYFTVFGTDQSGNSASQSDISSATTSSGYACSSTQSTYKWVFSITKNLKNCTCSNSNTTIDRGETFTATLSPNNNYITPTSSQVSVTMGGTTAQYVYKSGSLSIPDVTGDIVITAEASENTFCLAKGTKVLMANGKYKNIEDIEYADLLKVYNHITGEFTNEYPIWIEKEGTSSCYRKITFSDGNILKTVGHHSIFEVDKRKYIDVSNDNECKIGTRVYKVQNDKLEIVTITNIEDICEETKYYNVVSTMYYNIIANDILTTDATSSISNIYGFEDNAIYGENYYKISNGEKLEYKDVSFIPYYLYKGLNLQNAKCLINSGLNMDFLSSFINRHTVKFRE